MVAHNAKFDMKVVYFQYGVMLPDPYWDTQIGANLLNEMEPHGLKYLYDNRNQVISREQLLNGVWNYDILGTSRMVDIHISHLRDKIEKDPHHPEWIKTARGFGYLFDTAHLDK